jgi:ribosome-associated protein
MEEGIRVAEDTVIPLDEIRLRASRSSGPGGQHANVTASRIEAVFDVEESRALSDEQRDLLLRKLGPRVSAVAQDARSQARNRELALERLRSRLAAALTVQRPRHATKPTASSRTKRLDSKRRRSDIKRARRRPDADS